MLPAQDPGCRPDRPEDRGAAIFRRTLSAVSVLFGLWSAMLGAVAWSRRDLAAVDPRLLFLHAGLFGLAGTLLWTPRRGALVFTLLACAGSLYFVWLDLRSRNLDAALIDGLYILVAAALLYKSGRHP